MSKIPECNGRKRHAWKPDASLGCRENPGVLGGNGTRLTIVHACPHCGARRFTKNHIGGDFGAMINGWRVTYEAAS